MWIPVTPGSELALAGATVLANLSGSPITVGRARTRAQLCQSTSMRCLAAYIYAAAGAGESTTDLAWDGQTSIYENGVLLTESERFLQDGQIMFADIDLDLLRQERALMGTFDDNARGSARAASASRLHPESAGRRHRLPAHGRALPVRAERRAGSSRTATRPTTSRSPAWCSGCARPAPSAS